jgi:hypothetical protein
MRTVTDVFGLRSPCESASNWINPLAFQKKYILTASTSAERILLEGCIDEKHNLVDDLTRMRRPSIDELKCNKKHNIDDVESCIFFKIFYHAYDVKFERFFDILNFSTFQSFNITFTVN